MRIYGFYVFFYQQKGIEYHPKITFIENKRVTRKY